MTAEGRFKGTPAETVAQIEELAASVVECAHRYEGLVCMTPTEQYAVCKLLVSRKRHRPADWVEAAERVIALGRDLVEFQGANLRLVRIGDWEKLAAAIADLDALTEPTP